MLFFRFQFNKISIANYMITKIEKLLPIHIIFYYICSQTNNLKLLIL